MSRSVVVLLTFGLVGAAAGAQSNMRRDTLFQISTPLPVVVLGRADGGEAWIEETSGSAVLARGNAGLERYWWHIRRGVSTTLSGAPAGAPVRQSGVSITFLANEGVLLSSGDQQVLIDALFQKYETGYTLPADSTRAALERGTAAFDSVELVLVTHPHGDHFHPASVVAHLLANTRATLLTSTQVIDSLRGRLPARHELTPRLLARTTSPGARRRHVVHGIRVESLGLPHGGARHRGVEHLGYIVELGGRRVLHVGATEVTEAAFAPFRLDTARIDVALLPTWMVTSAVGQRVIERWIRPTHVVAFHIGDDDMESAPRAVKAAMPRAITFTRSLETRGW